MLEIGVGDRIGQLGGARRDGIGQFDQAGAGAAFFLRQPRGMGAGHGAAHFLRHGARPVAALGQGDARQFAQMAFDRGQLEGAGTRVVFIQQKQIHDGCGLEDIEITRAIGHGAVADLQQGAHVLGFARIRRGHGLADQPGGMPGPLQAPAQIHEQPVGSARHILRRQAGQGGGAAHQCVQIKTRRRGLERRLHIGQFLADGQGMNGAPGVQRNAVAHRPGGLLHPQQQSLQAAAVARAIDQKLQFVRQRFIVGNFLDRRIAGLAEGDQKLARDFQRPRRLVRDPRRHRAQDAHKALGALGIAAQPEQIVHGAAGRGLAIALDLHRPPAAGQQAEIVHRRGGDHPGILAGSPRLHGKGAGGIIRGDAGQPAGHHNPAGRCPGREDAQGDGPRSEHAILEGGRQPQWRDFLQHHGFAAAVQACDQMFALRGGHVGAQLGAGIAREQRPRVKGVSHHAVVELRQGRLAPPGGAAPDGGDVGYLQVFAQQGLRYGGKVSIHGGGFDHPAAQRIGQHHAARAHRLRQARHAQGAVAAKLQGIAEIGIDAAENGRDALQTGQGFQEHFAVAHRQIVALHQGEAEIMGQIDMLEIGFIVGTRRQQHGAVAPCRAQFQDAFAVGIEEGGQPRHPHVAEAFGKGLGDDQPVFQCIAQPARRIGAAGGDLPAAVGAARQVGGIQMHMHALRRGGAAQRAQELGMAGDQMGRQHALLDQPLRTIDVAEQHVRQHGALNDGCFDGLPVGRRQDEGHDVELPGPGMAAPIVIDVIGDAIILHRSAGTGLAAFELLARQLGKRAGEGAPMRPHFAVTVAQFIKTGRWRAQRFCDFRHLFSHALATHAPLRRSRV